MDFGELKTTVLGYMHRPDLTAEVAGFVGLAEGLIRRDLRADTYSVTLDEDDRVEGGVYTLPTGLLEVRRIVTGGRPLTQVGLDEIQRLPASLPPLQWCAHGASIEVKGTPAENAEIELRYFGHPAPLSDDGDENELLTNHPALYIYGSMFFGYQFTQELELAQAALDTFSDTLEKLNEAAGRKLGGARMRGAYAFGPLTRGY